MDEPGTETRKVATILVRGTMKRASTHLLLATIHILVFYSFASGTPYQDPEVILQEGNALPKIQLVARPQENLRITA